jgi:predicted HicB family RNase H-like nuclease
MVTGNNNNYLHYKGYVGSIEFSEEDSVFHGKVVGVKSLLSFEGDSVKTITDIQSVYPKSKSSDCLTDIFYIVSKHQNNSM